MLARLALLFVVVPLIELVLLIRLGQWVGLWPTLGLVIFTGVLGASLARAEGLRTLAAFQREVSAGRLPGQALLDGISILVGGAFLLTPGLLTDLVGFALLLPATRQALQRAVRGRLEEGIRSGDIRVHVWSGSPFGPGGPGQGADGDSLDDPGTSGEGTRERKPGLDPSKEIRPDGEG